jgi:hypothetical protein
VAVHQHGGQALGFVARGQQQRAGAGRGRGRVVVQPALEAQGGERGPHLVGEVAPQLGRRRRVLAAAGNGHAARQRGGKAAAVEVLLDKMLVDGEVCIRLLSGAAGDRSTAHALNVA